MKEGPKRIQRKRTKGWKMPANTVYVGRPSKWGNIFNHEEIGRRKAVSLFRKWLCRKLYKPERDKIGINPLAWLHLSVLGSILVKDAKQELRGKNLACWCPLNQPCHADVLREIANTPTVGDRTEEEG